MKNKIIRRVWCETKINVYTDKRENEIFLINKEIHMGAVAKSYLRKGFLIHVCI
jgi:hypothetical protein